ncbi:MAG: TIGR03617 family F420-dependent LLM class oxidoreductase [Gammaproteobacteria bacterium]
MKIDAPLRDLPAANVACEALRLEELGFDGVWTFETRRDPFLPLMQVALATERMNIGTNIAVAFARSPFATALVAWDLQRASHGRLLLGLGTQVRAHVERRFSSAFDHPAARVVDYIRCVRSIWDTYQTGDKPDYEGRYFRFTLINGFFNPGPIEHPRIPIYLAGVNPRMAQAAGEIADGFSVHPMHSPAYLREVVLPAIDDGARERGLTASDLVMVADTFVVRGDTPTALAESEARVRRQVAFYASTPSYRRFLEFHGEADAGKALSALMRAGELDKMPALVSDKLLAELAVCEADGDLASQIKARYKGGLVQRVTLYEPIESGGHEQALRKLTRSLHAAG